MLYNQNIFNLKQNVARMHRQNMFRSYDDTSPQVVDNVKNNIIDDTSNLKKEGEIAIPKLGILLPIYNQPYNSRALNKGAQQIPTNSGDINTWGNGNLGIVGHNYNDGYSYFSSLQEKVNDSQSYIKDGQPVTNNWLNGQKIYIATASKIFEYSVIRQYLVLKNNDDVLNDTSNAQINLITCLEPDDNYRIITNGVLDNSWRWDDAPPSVINYFDHKKFKYNLKVGV